MKKFLKNNKLEIFAFIIPILVFTISIAFAKIWPFGESYIAAYDGSAQYPGFTTYLTNVLRGDESLFYSFKGGLGFNFYATAIYYLFNPSNILSIFFNKDNIMIFYTLIVFLRIGLSGVTMSLYLKTKNPKNNNRLIFSIAYALMAYNVLYFYNFMYFDTIVLFPLVILGLDRLIDGKRPILYILFLTLSIISNFYIGSMVCIFSLLYFIYKFIILKKKKKIIATFIISSLLSGIMCTFIILPVFFELINGKSSLYGSGYTIYNKWGLDFFASFYRLSIASYTNGDQVAGYPNIYCSLLVFVYTALFFFNNKFSKKEKIATAIFIVFFLLCFSFNLLDYAWQFFQKPIWYPNRYSFVFSFFLITVAFKSFSNKEALNIKPIKLIIIITILLALIINSAIFCEVFKADISKKIFLVLSLICIIEYMLSYNIKKLIIILFSVFILEMSANTISGLKQISYAKKVSSYNETHKNLDKAFSYVEQSDNSLNNFYRADSNIWTNINNGSTFNYNGMIYFNSLRNGKMMYFIEHYGNYNVQDQCSVRFNANNVVLTSLLGFKYIVSNSEESYYEKINNNLEYKVYKNNEALSLGFMMNSNIKNIDLIDSNHIENSINIIDYSLNEKINAFNVISYDNIIKYVESLENNKKFIYYNSTEGGHVVFKRTADKNYILYANPKITQSTKTNLIINDMDDYQITYNGFSPTIINKNDKYELKTYFTAKKILSDDIKFYLLDVDKYKYWINKMKDNELKITTYKKDSYIKGSINVTEDKTTLFTSIPYDKGWRVYVDGKKINYTKLLTTFIGFDLTPGKHTIEFRYIPKGLILGSFLSLLALIISVFYVKKIKEI